MSDQPVLTRSSTEGPRVTVVIPAPLRTFTDGSGEIEVVAKSVATVIAMIGAQNDGLTARILTPEGDVRPLVNIFVGKDDIRSLDGLDTPLENGAVVTIIPAIAGG
jgi:molybdopterin synthase sulfur carrier subunit